jgi:hypothetical protein
MVNRLQTLLSNSTCAATSWEKARDDILIRQCTGEFSFGYEFMGLNGRLVITALTDRCYMTITTALTYTLVGRCRLTLSNPC